MMLKSFRIPLTKLNLLSVLILIKEERKHHKIESKIKIKKELQIREQEIH